MANARSVLDALGEPTRRTIFERVAESPGSVGEIAAGLPITRSAVSQHLKVLKSAGLVTDQAVGTKRIYRVDPHTLQIMRAYFDAFWTRSLRAFQTAAEQSAEEPS
ncbi:ArsR/SmtB family transcription factor [Actinocatenispora rupis]|uniref:Transcriptional regulator n=1 Tax=Actinocatenispora rupis TaxID=519421 RepID=A0A8J3J244_9ACTN|nr:metalloregulator ArsR/SmtB family transcription factor [Actinocatenispora rupis]GID10141.1 transcriptional regulator [Actinocatenispora rupis]